MSALAKVDMSASLRDDRPSQGGSVPTQGLHDCVSGWTLSDSRDDPGPPRVGGRARGWDHANHAPGSVTRLSRDHVAAREDRGGHTGPPTPASGHAEAGSSVAPTPAAGPTNTGDGGENITRTCLLGEKADISKLG